jgi:PAB1-binding protein PBP1
MNVMKTSAALVLMSGLVSAGCKSNTSETAKVPPAPMKSPATQPVAMTPTAKPTPTMPAMATTPVPEKDLTHVLSKDEPYYASSPAQGKPADGTLKAGTKVLVMMPRGSYSQVVTADGKKVYTSTSGLKPVGN